MPGYRPVVGGCRVARRFEYVGDDMAKGTVALTFVFPHGRITVYNALDENGIDFDPLIGDMACGREQSCRRHIQRREECA